MQETRDFIIMLCMLFCVISPIALFILMNVYLKTIESNLKRFISEQNFISEQKENDNE